MTKNKARNSAVILVSFLLTSNTAFALPTMSSVEDQNFNKYATATQVNDIKITEDPMGGFIKAGSLKVTIPAGIEMIFDAKRSAEEYVVFGSAVTNGRIEAKPIITFVDADKSFILPVKQDFAPGEYVIVSRLFAEGFHSTPANSQKLILTLQNGDQILDVNYKNIFTSTNDDTTSPDLPTALTVTDAPTGVYLEWKDPTDLDLKIVQIYRGKNGSIIGGTPVEIPKGVQKYNDTDLKTGDIVEYQLKALDGRNDSGLTPKVTYTVGTSSATPPSTAPAPILPPPPTSLPTEVPAPKCKTYFPDVSSNSPNCEAIQFLKINKIISGYPDGTFGPDKEVNRVELLKMAMLTFNKKLQTQFNANYKDIDKNAWYIPYLSTATSLAIISGYPDGTFKPNQTVSKVEAMKIIFLSSAIQLPIKPTVKPFNDTPLASWYLPYVQYFKNKNIDLGDAEGNLNPTHPMTRAEIAEYLYGFSKL